MEIKNKLREKIPSVCIKTYSCIRKKLKLLPYYSYTYNRVSKYVFDRTKEESCIGSLTMACHGLEKGFTMPDFRPGFGYDRINKLLSDAIRYVNIYGTDNVQIHHIAKVINDYKLCHKKCDFELNSELIQKIDKFLAFFNDSWDSQIQKNYTKNEYFAKKNDNFPSFSNSRHSCRNFTKEPVDNSKIEAAIKLAQNSPSACNRQPTRLYVVTNKEKIAQIFAIHGGNRGFGHTVDKLIVICGYINCYGFHERDCVFVDCGIFTMNLAYALHYYEVGNCILNWSVKPKNDKEIRRIIPIKDEEIVCTLIACGNVPSEFKVCDSGKKDIRDILTFI